MPRAPHPKGYQIWVALARRPYCDYPKADVHSVKIKQRVYDRSKGNFAAVGWLVRLQFYRPIPEPLLTIDTVILDSEMPNYVQTSLK